MSVRVIQKLLKGLRHLIGIHTNGRTNVFGILLDTETRPVRRHHESLLSAFITLEICNGCHNIWSQFYWSLLPTQVETG